MQPRNNLIDRIARYITRLPHDHPASLHFGARLQHTPFVLRPPADPADPDPHYPEEDDADNTIFLYRFPVEEGRASADYGVPGVDADIYASNTAGLCVRPEGGAPPDPAMGTYNPSFSLVCRHEYHGRAYNCLQALIHEFAYNPRALRQNGLILALHSQPALVWNDRRGISAYIASFRCMVAEAIN